MLRVLVLMLLAASTSNAWSQSRPPWNDSSFEGTPDPPLPFVLERAYPKQEFMGPVAVVPFPHSDRLVIVEQKGKIFSFSTSKAEQSASLMCDFQATPPPKSKLSSRSNRSFDVYSVAFHPEFAQNRLVYICYVDLPATPKDADGTHIASFRVTDDPIPTIDLSSEKTILTCGGGGHNGATLLFGPDRMLYVSIGDLESPSPPDRLNTGQDITDLYASILRIDVDHPDPDRAYSIPKDNPFLHIANARHEVYSFGFRNPWRMSFDEVTGDLWVGDVGWEMYEMVYRVRSGGNYGWSIKEGPGDVRPNLPLGPTPILPADVALSHADAASVTGGFVYRGKQFPDLHGRYIFGDWITRRFWAVPFDRDSVGTPIEIASTHVKPICFAIDHDGELLVLDYANVGQKAGLYRFVRNRKSIEYRENAHRNPFPFRISQSGLFSDTKKRIPKSGVVPYRLNATMWSDGALPEYLLAIPGEGQATFHQEGQTTFDWFRTKVQFPVGTVLAKTYVLPTIHKGEPKEIPLETQIAHYAGVADWRYYSYRWNDEGTDATLVGPEGDRRTVEFPMREGSREAEKGTWHFASRGQCRTCHTTWAGESLGIVEPQLRRPTESSDSWRELLQKGFARLGDGKKPASEDRFTAMASIHDSGSPIDIRARSYLHVNCSHCHMFGAVGSSTLDFPFDKSLADTKSVDQIPMKGDFGIPDARLIAAGAPERSLLLYRMAKMGTGRMPHIGSQSIDREGVQLIHDWIQQLPREEKLRNALDRLLAPESRINDMLRMQAAEELLADPVGSMLLVHAIRAQQIPKRFRDPLIERCLESHDLIRDAIEPLARPEQRVERLGVGFDSSLLLQTQGDIERGKNLFQRGVGQCNQCHRVDGQPKSTGPDLSKIGSKYARDQLLLHIVKPSSTIDPAYQGVAILTSDGTTRTGRVLERSSSEILFQPASGDPIRLKVEDIELEKKLDKSLMPEDLLSSLTRQQAVDLLAYLTSRKE